MPVSDAELGCSHAPLDLSIGAGVPARIAVPIFADVIKVRWERVMARLGAIVLAAGTSRRFGAENKLLADFEGEPIVRRLVCQAVSGGIAEILVVTGHDKERITAALENLPVRFTHNANWRSGMGSTIAVGIAALSADVEGVFMVPADMPRLTSTLFLRLAQIFEENCRSAIVFPTAAGEQRNPVLWPRRLFPELLKLSGASGAKEVLSRYSSESVSIPIEDSRVFDDVDTPEDLWLARCGSNLERMNLLPK